MAIQFAKFLAPLTVVGAPIATTTGLLAWKLGTIDEKQVLDVWLRQAISIGGGGENGDLKKLKKDFKGGIKDWTHPGLFVESVGEYMERILNKKDGSAGEKLKFGVKNVKKVIEKVGFEYDKYGSLKLNLGINSKSNKKFTHIKEGNKLCVISVAKSDGQESLNFLIGFFSRIWTKDTSVTMEADDEIIGGFNDWCARRAETFNQERNLVVGIHLNPLNVTIYTPEGSKITKIDYYVDEKGAGFVGKDTTNTPQKGWSRICASTKDQPRSCDKDNWPVVLGVIGNKKFNSKESVFGETAVAEDFSEIFWAGGNKPQLESSITRATLNNPPLSSVPIGVKFTDVKITGKTLENWSKSPN